MAGGSDNVVIYYRNHNASDTTRESVLNDLVARSVDRLGFSAPEGMEFSAWNTAQDASGISYAVGDTVTLSQNSGAELYAVWVVPVIPYIVTSEELTDVADAIRTKGGTSAALVWPSGYVDAVGAIEGGGGGAAATVSVEWTLSPMMPGSIGPTFYYVGSDGTYRSYECEEMNSPTPLSVLTPSIIAAESGTWSASGSIDLYKTPNYFYKLAFVYGDGRISAESG